MRRESAGDTLPEEHGDPNRPPQFLERHFFARTPNILAL